MADSFSKRLGLDWGAGEHPDALGEKDGQVINSGPAVFVNRMFSTLIKVCVGMVVCHLLLDLVTARSVLILRPYVSASR